MLPGCSWMNLRQKVTWDGAHHSSCQADDKCPFSWTETDTEGYSLTDVAPCRSDSNGVDKGGDGLPPRWPHHGRRHHQGRPAGRTSVTFRPPRSIAFEPGLLDGTTRGPLRGQQREHITLRGQAEAPKGQPCLGVCGDKCRAQTQAPLGLPADFAGPGQPWCPLGPRSFPEYKVRKVSSRSRDKSPLLLQGFLTLGASLAQAAVAWEASEF